MKVAVMLSGCGVYDGTEIHEAVLTLLALARAGVAYQCLAPNMTQAHVVNHLTGAVSDGETSEAAALREVREETGIEARILRPLDTTQYSFRGGDVLIHKRVDFYLMEYVAGELEPQLSEVDDVQWFELSSSLEHASFASERKLLEMAIESSSLRVDESSSRRDSSSGSTA